MAPLLKKPWVLSLICFGLMAAAAAWFLWRFPPRQGRLVFLNVGQGDSILIETPEGHRVLIDDGPDDAVLSALGRQLGFLDRTIDMLLITHPDRDHYGGTLDLLDRYEVKRVLLTGVVSDDAFYEAFRKKISDLGIPVTLARVNEDWRLSARAALDVLYPFEGMNLEGRAVEEKNNTSVVARLMVFEEGAWRPLALLTGDAEAPQERQILEQGMVLAAPILKMGHHGSKSSSSAPFVAAVQPTTSIVSAGKNNRYGHPHAEALERVAGTAVRRTDREGDVVVEWGKI